MEIKSTISIVLLGHLARSGKDTVADWLVSEYGYTKINFADKLKEVVADLYDFDHVQMYDWKKDVEDKRYPNTRDTEYVGHGSMIDPNPNYKPFLTPRRVLQLFGQDQRSLCPDIWPRIVCNKILYHTLADLEKFVIADFRFPNEYDYVAQMCKKNDFKLTAIRIDRDRNKRKLGDSMAEFDISETALEDFDKWDCVISNNGTKEELFNSVKNIKKLELC